MDPVIFTEVKRKRLVQAILKLYRNHTLQIHPLLHDIMLIELGEGTPSTSYHTELYGKEITSVSAFKPHLLHYMMNMNERHLLALFGYKQFDHKQYTRRI